MWCLDYLKLFTSIICNVFMLRIILFLISCSNLILQFFILYSLDFGPTVHITLPSHWTICFNTFYFIILKFLINCYLQTLFPFSVCGEWCKSKLDWIQTLKTIYNTILSVYATPLNFNWSQTTQKKYFLYLSIIVH